MTITQIYDSSKKDFFSPIRLADRGNRERESFSLTEKEFKSVVSKPSREDLSETLIEGDLDTTLRVDMFLWLNMPSSSSNAGASTIISREEFIDANLGEVWNFAYDSQSNYTKLYVDFQTKRENPVVYAETRIEGKIEFYRIEIDKINPQNATKAEMHALVNYVYDDSDDIFVAGTSVESMFDIPDYNLKTTQNKVDFIDGFGEATKRIRNYLQTHQLENDFMHRKLKILEEILSLYIK